MRIGIDCRMAGTGEGIGRYIEELVLHLSKIDFDNEYVLITNRDLELKNSRLPPACRQGRVGRAKSKFQIRKVSSPYYSWAEQTRFIWELMKLKLDLVHFSSFNSPIFYPGKFMVTIHDIIHHIYPGKKKSRWFHRFAYKLTIRSAVMRATKIIAVSEATKQDILATFHIPNSKIQVIYEGVKPNFFAQAPEEKISDVKKTYGISKPYILFVGVWRQYKNLPRLALAFDILKEKYKQDIQLVLAGKIDPFYPEIKNQVFGVKNYQDIKALNYVPDEALFALYQGARAFILPSLVEGFGLIAIEAQASGVPVIASQIPVLKEVLRDSALYFDPQNEQDMADKINALLSKNELAQGLIQAGRENATRFTWSKSAEKTLEIYKTFGGAK